MNSRMQSQTLSQPFSQERMLPTKNTRLKLLAVLGTLGFSMSAMSADVVVDPKGVVPYVTDSRNVVVTSGSGLCVQASANWSPAAAEQAKDASGKPLACSCDPDLIAKEKCEPPKPAAPVPSRAETCRAESQARGRHPLRLRQGHPAPRRQGQARRNRLATRQIQRRSHPRRRPYRPYRQRCLQPETLRAPRRRRQEIPDQQRRAGQPRLHGRQGRENARHWRQVQKHGPGKPPQQETHRLPATRPSRRNPSSAPTSNSGHPMSAKKPPPWREFFFGETAMTNVDPLELAKFDEHAHHWWDPTSEFRPLHEINPLRLSWIRVARHPCRQTRARRRLRRRHPLRRNGAARHAGHRHRSLRCRPRRGAKLHLLESGLSVDYRPRERRGPRRSTSRCLRGRHLHGAARARPRPRIHRRRLRRDARPGGWAFFATISCTPKATCAILGAEYLLRLLPRGTTTSENSSAPPNSPLGAIARARTGRPQGAGLQPAHENLSPDRRNRGKTTCSPPARRREKVHPPAELSALRCTNTLQPNGAVPGFDGGRKAAQRIPRTSPLVNPLESKQTPTTSVSLSPPEGGEHTPAGLWAG